MLRDGSFTDLSETDVVKRMSDTDAVQAIVSDVQALQVELAEKTELVRHLQEQRMLLKAWEPVTNRLGEVDTASTTSLLVARETSSKQSLTAMLDQACDQHITEYGVEILSTMSALVTIAKSDTLMLDERLAAVGLQVIDRPDGSEAAAIELSAVEEKLAAAKGELGVTHDQAEHVAHTHIKQLRIASELLDWEHARFITLDSGRSTVSTAVFDGWLVADKQVAIETQLTDKNIAAVFVERDLADDEEPPVEIENSPALRPFEAVTRLYGMPGYKDLDPTVFLAGFFFLFFGLSLTDVGYGLTLVVISGGLLAFAKLSAGVQMMMRLLFYIGTATVLVGMLFGGYFGIAIEQLPAPLQALQLFDPIGNPLPVFYLALGLGVFQVMVGMVLKIYSEARNGRLSDALWEQGPWLFLFSVGIAYVLSIAQLLVVPTDTLVTLAYLGLGLIVLGAVVRSSGILQAVMNIGGGLYASVGYLSDILSYSRLLALGLATTALAYAVNLIAGIVYDSVPYIGPIFALAVLIIGHVFTLAVNTLGAFIHSARLQFVEFFGKFVAGSGRSFKPLARSSTHVTITKE
jgi:V/A-type H+-transporting ATPase subunit I